MQTEIIASALTPHENTELEICEAAIKRGLGTFVEVGLALLTIRDKQLYRAQYKTFEDYCREKWGIERAHAYRLIDSAEVIKNLSPIGDILPANEAQTRPLASLEPDEQRQAWEQAVEIAPNGKPTAAIVQQVVQDFNYKRDMRRSSPQDIYTPHGMDACQTPGYAVDPLLPFLTCFDNIWEPAAGEGLLVDALLDCTLKRFTVLGSDLITGQNFFEYEPEAWDCIVTNPPYSIKFQWLERCYRLGKPFALLLPVDTIGAKTAQQLFKTYGVEIMLLDKRVNFKMPQKGWYASGAQFSTAWFTWGLALGAQLYFGELEYD